LDRLIDHACLNPEPRTLTPSIPVALTIAGSDSGGGAGIQADLKTFTAMKVFGTSAITCLTAQNPDWVSGIEAVSPAMVTKQIRAVTDGFPVAAAKTGMLFSSPLIRAVARELKRGPSFPLVVDPVMVATSGARLLREDAMQALCTILLPMAAVITPNLQEAEILADRRIRTLNDLTQAACRISRRFSTACIAKGGHLEGNRVVDVLCVDGEITLYTLPRARVAGTHGTGCTFSAALTAALATGNDLHEAVAIAKAFVTNALCTGKPSGKHTPLNFFQS
jgi:hydroxymethylpyrimidine/phosphomethylpyrimidine kinase